MARLKGPVWKKSRRLDFSVLETGEELSKRSYGPGQHGPTKRVKLSNYGLQLREKQRIRYLYNMNEKQFYNTYLKAQKMPGVTGTNFLVMLESRLDNLVYRLGLGRTRRAARQLVTHGHILVNGKKVDIPSYTCRPNDVIELKDSMKNNPAVADAIKACSAVPAYLRFDKDLKKGFYLRYPERSELNPEISESLVVEFYNR